MSSNFITKSLSKVPFLVILFFFRLLTISFCENGFVYSIPFTSATQTTKFAYELLPNKTDKPSIDFDYDQQSLLLGFNGNTTQGVKITLSLALWTTYQSSQWYTARMKIFCPDIGNNLQGQIWNWRGVLGFDSTVNFSSSTINGIPSQWTWLETSLFTTDSGRGIPQMYFSSSSVISSTGTIYVKELQVIGASGSDHQVVFTSSTIVFYLQDSSGYLPVTAIFNSIDTDTVTISMINQKPDDVPNSHYISRYWIINREGSSPFDVTLTFSYTTDDVIESGISESDLYPVRYNTNTSTWETIQTGISRDLDNHTLTVTGITGFSRWTLGGLENVSIMEWEKYNSGNIYQR